jgi:hypothetical protein
LTPGVDALSLEIPMQNESMRISQRGLLGGGYQPQRLPPQ